MSNFDLETEGLDLPGLTEINNQVVASTKTGTKYSAKRLKKRIEETSPVDTGRYKSDWHIEEDDEYIYIVNEVPYAKHLVFPNSNFVGSAAADRPGVGILHNVRGMVHSHKSGFFSDVAGFVKKVL